MPLSNNKDKVKISPAVRAALGAYIKMCKNEKKFRDSQKHLSIALMSVVRQDIDIYYKLTDEFDKKFNNIL
jgi:hypothetical protein